MLGLTYLHVPDNSLKVEVGATYDYVDNDQEISPLNSNVACETPHQDSVPYHSIGPDILQTGTQTSESTTKGRQPGSTGIQSTPCVYEAPTTQKSGVRGIMLAAYISTPYKQPHRMYLLHFLCVFYRAARVTMNQHNQMMFLIKLGSMSLLW